LTEHTFLEMVRSRVYGILAGYEDQNDHDTRRADPVFKLVADLVSVPVVAAGGIADARGIVAAFASAPKAFRSGPRFSPVKSRGRARSIARPCSAARRARQR
jgi:hypothetical protein